MDLIVRTCPVCGKEFQANRKDRLYCSTPCRKHAYYLRHRERILKNNNKYRLEHKDYNRNYYKKHKEELKQHHHDYYIRKKKEVFSQGHETSVKSKRYKTCPYDDDCFHCPAPDCVMY